MARRQHRSSIGCLRTGSAACILIAQLTLVICQHQPGSQLLNPLRYSLELPRGVRPAMDIDPEVRPAPSLAGRIIEATSTTLQAPTTTSTTATQMATSPSPISEATTASVSKSTSTTTQLSPRKAPVNSDPAAAEQKIISQHSRARPYGADATYQRISPHRDTSSSSGNSNRWTSDENQASGTRDSPLSSLFENFRSGISSRSSIVKAISDNKLARTISTVGKTLGGNKYVAGAAAASVLAALGLTVSKLSGKSFMFSPSYSKFGDPMLGSGSYISPTILAPRDYMDGGRDYASFISDQTATSLAPSSSEQPLFVINPSPMNLYSGAESHHYNLDTSSSDHMPVTQANVHSGFQNLYPKVFATYTRQPTTGQTGQHESSASMARPVALGDPHTSSSGSDQSIRGHYSSFFENDPPPVETSDSSAASSHGYDSLVPSASGSLPTFSGSFQNTRPVANARRSGTVSLKMDSATRQRLIEQLIRQQEYLRQAQNPGYMDEPQPRPDRPQIAAIYVPASSLADGKSGADYNFRGITINNKQQTQLHYQAQPSIHSQLLAPSRDKQQTLPIQSAFNVTNSISDGSFQPMTSSSRR